MGVLHQALQPALSSHQNAATCLHWAVWLSATERLISAHPGFVYLPYGDQMAVVLCFINSQFAV